MREKLSDKLLQSKRLVPASGQRDVWDELLPQFGARVSYGGRVAFQVLTRVNGKLRRFTLGSYPGLSLADAREQARNIIKDAQQGIAPDDRELEQRAKARQQRANTFATVAAEFMLDHGSKLRSSYQLRRMLDAELLPAWGDLPIASITRADCKSLLRAKAAVAPIAANRLASLISKIFAWCLDEELIESSPAQRLPKAAEHARERSLTAAEIATLWPAFNDYPFGTALRFLLATGQRRGEVANLKWSDLVDGGNTWKLSGSGTKSGRGHSVPLSSLAREIIESCPRIGPYVFATAYGRLAGWHRAKTRIDDSLAAPIEEAWTIHDLRRTMATMMRSIGIDRLVVSKLLNHSEAGVTAVYDRYTADPEKTAAAERWAQRLREIISGDAGGNVVPMIKVS